jgi:hypothetical protein
MSGFTVVRTPLILLGEMAAVLTGPDRFTSLMQELVKNPHVRVDIIQDVLSMHKVPQPEIDRVVSQYQQAKVAS